MKRYTAVAAAALALAGCGREHAAPVKAAPAAKVENGGIRESDLARVTLTPEAARRLGIETAAVEVKDARQIRTYSGEVVVPPGQAIVVSAPVAGNLAFDVPLAPGEAVSASQPLLRILPLVAPDRDLLPNREAEVETARVRLEAARVRLTRAERMLRDQTGSVKAVDAAGEEVGVAQSALAAAKKKLEAASRAPYEVAAAIAVKAPSAGIVRQVMAGSGQAVAAGAALLEIARLDTLWVRVPVYAGEVGQIDRTASAEVRTLGAPATSHGEYARPATAPPSADPAASTADLYYQIGNAGQRLRPGERLSVSLPLRGASRRLQAPSASVLYDVHGGAWVYEAVSQTAFVRRRVEVDYVSGSSAILAAGPKPGTKLVTAGAAELFGTEFGPGK